jgi:hypothetical protein
MKVQYAHFFGSICLLAFDWGDFFLFGEGEAFSDIKFTMVTEVNN